MGAAVSRGGKTASGSKTQKATTRQDREEALKVSRPVSRKDEGVAYVGDTDHLFARGPRPILNKENEVVGRDPGLFIEFHAGRTKTYYPEKYAADAAFVEEMDAWIASGDRTVEKYSIARVEPDAPKLPFDIPRWNTLSADTLKAGLELLLGKDPETDAANIEACKLFEVEVGGEREEVLVMLDGLLDEDAQGDPLDMELSV